ncbi:MAG: hypothetical protein ACTHOJ_01900 [Sphingomonas oligoaromativorans]
MMYHEQTDFVRRQQAERMGYQQPLEPMAYAGLLIFQPKMVPFLIGGAITVMLP